MVTGGMEDSFLTSPHALFARGAHGLTALPSHGRCLPWLMPLLMLVLFWLPAASQSVVRVGDNVALGYHLEIQSSGTPAIDDAVARASLLMRLRDEGPVPPIALVARAEADRVRIDEALRSLGYYDAVIAIQIDGVDVSEPRLAETLAARSDETGVAIEVRIDKGPLYRLGEARLEGDIPPAIATVFDLRRGEPAEAGRVLAAGAALLEALREDGFALAEVSPPLATVDHRTRDMSVIYRVDPGSRVAIGVIEFNGLERLTDKFARRRLGLMPGDAFSPSRLEQARRALVASPAVAAARIQPAAATAADGRLPLQVRVVEAKRRSLRVAGSFATEDGASLLLGWTHRNLFGRAEQLDVRTKIGGLTTGQARDAMDYAAGVSLRWPDRWRRDLDLSLDLAAVSESLNAYDRDSLTFGGQFAQRLTPRLSLAWGMAVERARVTQDGQTTDFHLLSLPTRLDWDSTDNVRAPRQGWRLRVDLVPVPWVHGEAEPFTRARVTATGYLDLAADRRSAGNMASGASGSTASNTLLAGRVTLGGLLGAAASDVPPDWRFYAGGAGSVRGYPLQSIGPRTARGDPAGGDLLIEGSIELRRRLHGPWGLVAFVDGASVSANDLPRVDGTKLGVGLGLRFHTVIGPLRADLAFALAPYPDDSPVQLYLGIGEAF